MADISKTLIAILLVATILISVIGTWTLLNTVDKAITVANSFSKGYGKISINIVSQGTGSAYGGTGKVSVNIQPR